MNPELSTPRLPSPRRRRLVLGLGVAPLGTLPWPVQAQNPPQDPGETGPAAAAPDAPDAPAAPASGAYAERPQALAWAQTVSERHGLPVEAVLAALSQAVHQPSVVKAVMPPATGQRKNWSVYRNRFLDPVRIRAGAAFVERHGADLARAQARWGVPAEVVLGILGVETLYGRHPGRYRVLDALATLAFDFPAGRKDRSAFFRDELAELLVLARRLAVPPTELLGSYAGAMGWPQFMPSSWNRHAVDFDGDARADLIGSPVDAIGSVANFLAQHQWVPGLPTHYPVTPPSDAKALAELLAPDIVPSFSVAQMQALGARLPPVAQAHPGPLALVLLENGDAAPTYCAGTQNFFALTRYNWSSYYAMAVIELGSIVHAVGQRARAAPQA